MTLAREKRVRVGSVELGITLEAKQYERLRNSRSYRLLRPALNRLRRRTNAAHGPYPPLEPARTPELSAASPEERAVLERIAGIEWYHAIDLPHGVTTPGFVDHRRQISLYGLPDDMRGMRALDVATYDGFWAFEMERRGAEVVGIDLESFAQCDFPLRLREYALSEVANKKTGLGFAAAKELLGSRVERVECSVYDLSPERVGSFDLVFLSDLLLHLRDPQRALENVFSVTRPSGCAIIADVYNPDLEGFKDVALTEFGAFFGMRWWTPSTATLRAMLRMAGFDTIEEIARFQLTANSTSPLHKVVLKGRR
jgi:tRNA (mo5U34)-methyltransferase